MVVRILFALLFSLAGAEMSAQFSDDFSDGDFTQNPVWAGETGKFVVNPQFRLQLNAPPVTDTAVLVTQNQAVINATWEFYCRLDFAPSTSNFARVYLISNSPQLKGALNGYFVRIGGATGTVDDISLYRQDGLNTVKIIDGTDGTVATNPELTIKVTRSPTGLWTLEIDTGLTGTYQPQGTATDLTHTVSSHFGVFCKYTSTRSDKFFFDDFVVSGTPFVDTDPPIADSVAVSQSNELTVYFNEPLDPASSQQTGNYSVNQGYGNPVSALFSAGSQQMVVLTFANNFVPGNYQLTVSGVADTTGNVSGSQSLAFAVNAGTVYGDVIINEVMADPVPVVGLPDAEFIELFNASGQPVDLSGWQYSDASITTTLPSRVLPPGDFLILCRQADTALFSGYGLVAGLSPWPSLNNTGDFLGLRNAGGALIDTVAYTSDWYRDDLKKQGGWTLERINPHLQCSGANNWKASVNPQGGSPGVQNSVFDTASGGNIPVLTAAGFTALNEITLEYDSPLDTTQAGLSNFSIQPSLAIAGVDKLSPSSLRLALAQNADKTQVYDLTVSGLMSCEGASLPDTVVKIAYGVIPSSGNMVINEIYPDPDPLNGFLPDGEFVELYNLSNEPVRLDGVTFSDRNTIATLPLTVLLPGDFLILAPEEFENAYKVFGKTLGLTPWPSLNNSGDVVILSVLNGNRIESVAYDASWYRDDDKKQGGWSLEKINFKAFCTGAANWAACNDYRGATPGEPNSITDTLSETKSGIALVRIDNDTMLAIVFRQMPDAGALEPDNFSIDNGPGVKQVLFDSLATGQTTLILSDPLERGIVYQLRFKTPVLCNGDSVPTAWLSTFMYPDFNDLIVNEVLFNPRSGGSDFVELYNKTDVAIDLSGWALAYLNNSGDTAYKLLTGGSRKIYPKSFVVLTEDPENILFEYPNSVDTNFLETDLPSYNNTEGTVTMVDPSGMVIDELHYNENMHSPVLSETEGVSLERVSYDRPTADPTNWHSAASTVGYATPGRVNSQNESGGVANGEITLEPKTFSPDNDGYNDILNIRYRFEKEGYTGTISIFDANGGEVFTLVNNQLFGISGTISWDGRDRRGEVVNPGMYIILVRLLDTDGNQRQYKEVVVVATR